MGLGVAKQIMTKIACVYMTSNVNTRDGSCGAGPFDEMKQKRVFGLIHYRFIET